jgi:hypothetical protein
MFLMFSMIHCCWKYFLIQISSSSCWKGNPFLLLLF